jgi:ELWxxDGT repeat protein
MKNLNFFLFCLVVFAAQAVSAQTFSSIDINPGPGNSSPYTSIAFNGNVYFRANGDAATGGELWASDGTAAGTHMVKDIWPGPGSSSPNRFKIVGSKLFFDANDSIHGTELWVTDGTTAGTVMVADIYSGISPSYPDDLTAYNGNLYFKADDGIHGPELWVSDGTTAGTSLLKDINPGMNGSDPFAVNVSNDGIYVDYSFTLWNGKLYFRADDGVHGSELWVTDGSSAGTKMVVDIWQGPSGSNAYFMTPLGSNLILGATDSLHGMELWITDGTAPGTSLLKDIYPGTMGSNPADNGGFKLINGKLCFTAVTPNEGSEMWITDGTTAGTTLLKDIWPGPGFSRAGYFGMEAYNGKLYFSGVDSLNGSQLWTTDGTSAGTTLLKVLSTTTPYSSFPNSYIIYNGKMVFVASTDVVNQTQLWTSDGTAAGTHTIAPAVAPNANPLGYPPSFCILNGLLFMNANFNSIGDELWIYSTPTGITEASGEHVISAYPNPFSTVVSLSGLVNGEQYDVQVLDMTGREFYRSAISADQSMVSMPELSAGVYLMTVSGQSSSQTFKVVKQ